MDNREKEMLQAFRRLTAHNRDVIEGYIFFLLEKEAEERKRQFIRVK